MGSRMGVERDQSVSLGYEAVMQGYHFWPRPNFLVTLPLNLVSSCAPRMNSISTFCSVVHVLVFKKMALIENWMPPSRENWDLIVYLFQFFPIVSIIRMQQGIRTNYI